MIGLSDSLIIHLKIICGTDLPGENMPKHHVNQQDTRLLPSEPGRKSDMP